MKHTKGEWKVIYSSAHIGYQTFDVDMGKPIYGEMEANAKLIAAAPELLETLQRALNDFKNQTWTEETYTVINNAINKATL